MPVLDHIVLASADLGAGAAAFEATTGAALGPGGKHPLMGTHNRLCQAGGGAYLEVIAVDPDAPAPSRPRWFGLGDAAVQARIAGRPRALTFVVGTDDLDATLAGSPVPLGTPTAMSRGDLSWRLTLPGDGMPAEGGLVPAFIDWGGGPNPSAGMADGGVKLVRIVASHPDPARLAEIYQALRLDGLVEVVEGARGLSFVLQTPAGEVVFD